MNKPVIDYPTKYMIRIRHTIGNTAFTAITYRKTDTLCEYSHKIFK